MKLDTKSIGFKLWIYFTVFAAVILAVLWLLQTVFLQSLYTSMQKHQINKIADEICSAENTAAAVDELAADNSVLILLTDSSGNIIYSADEYSPSYRTEARGHGGGQNPYRAGEEQNWQEEAYRRLPEHYEDFLEKLGADDGVCYAIDRGDGGSLVCGRRLSDGNILYINTTLGAVGQAVSILRLQLCAVTFLALLLGLFIAVWIARRFSKPVSELSEQSLKMASGDFGLKFNKGFCSETDRLASSLEYAAAKIAETDKLRRELLANVSHDLRTPLTMIKGYAELIRDLDGSADAGKDAKIIIRESDRLSLLVNDILDYSKLQSGAAAFEFESVDLSAVAERTAEQFSAVCKSDGIEIITGIEPEKYVRADARRIEQVFYNLISNAAAHVGDDKRVYVSVAEKNGAVRAEIRDNGSGISADELAHIWDRYFTSKKRGSNGLGLSIVKEILTAHDARFGAQSETGKGSVFWFELAKARPNLP